MLQRDYIKAVITQELKKKKKVFLALDGGCSEQSICTAVFKRMLFFPALQINLQTNESFPVPLTYLVNETFTEQVLFGLKRKGQLEKVLLACTFGNFRGRKNWDSDQKNSALCKHFIKLFVSQQQVCQHLFNRKVCQKAFHCLHF